MGRGRRGGQGVRRRPHARHRGLVFAAHKRDVGDQFLPIRRNLADADLMNDWITPIGSAVFAVPPGCAEGGWIGETQLG